jgi:hypothetical protein
MTISRPVGIAWGSALLAAAGLALFQDVPAGFELIKTIQVAANVAWTDSGIDVKAGQEIYFEATGAALLQRDNPVANCGPEGLNLKTMQQPIPEQNLGALIGLVREKIEIVEDQQTKEKASRDIGEVFFIGAKNQRVFSAAGRLLLGLNENVPGDNDGAYEVKIYLKVR